MPARPEEGLSHSGLRPGYDQASPEIPSPEWRVTAYQGIDATDDDVHAQHQSSDAPGQSGGLPPAYNSTSNANSVDNVINRAYDELDMLVANGLSKMD